MMVSRCCGIGGFPIPNKPFPDEGDFVRVVAGFGVTDVGYGNVEGAGHGVEGVEVFSDLSSPV